MGPKGPDGLQPRSDRTSQGFSREVTVRRWLAIAIVPALLGGCATSDHGWSGSGAEPFNQAMADCRGRTAALGGKSEREFAIDTCMAGKGWTRPER